MSTPQPSVSFPFLGSDNQPYTGWTIPLDSNGFLTVSLQGIPLAPNAATSSNQLTMVNTLSNILTSVSSPIPSGGNIIGQVTIDQTTPGTTNKVSIGTDGVVSISSSVLPVGAATASNQTSTLTKLDSVISALGVNNTNTSVQLPLVASTAIIGKVGIDQTTPGTTNKVSIGTDGSVAISAVPPLVAGTAIIGKIGIDQTTPGTTNKVSIGSDGTVAIISSALPSGASTSSNQNTIITSLSNIQTSVASATPTGTNIIGRVGIDQTTPGTTNKVSIGTDGSVAISAVPASIATSANQSTMITSLSTIATNTAIQPPLVSGSALIGKVGIDQTTPGTTNKVSIGSDGSVSVSSLPSLVAGAAIVGKFGIDQTTPGTTNKVSIGTDGSVTVASSALPAGAATAANQTSTLTKLDTVNGNLSTIITNTGVQLPLVSGTAIVGKVGIDQTTPGTTNKVSIGTDGSVAINNFPTTTVIIGDGAPGAPDNGYSPVKIGGIGRTTIPSSALDGQRVNTLFDKAGRVVAVGAMREVRNRAYTSITNSNETAITLAGGTGVFLDLHSLLLTNPTSTVTTVTLRDSAGGTIVATYIVQANATAGFVLPVDSGWKQSVAASTWTVTVSGGSLYVTATWVAIM